jgi:hypothetical protein
MIGGLIIVWSLALLAIGALLIALVRTCTVPLPTRSEDGGRVEGFQSIKDTLLFYYETQSVSSALDGRVLIHIPGVAWDPEWRHDLLRIEVATRDPGVVSRPPEWGQATVLAAYDLAAYRMTEMGTDVAVERFWAPVEVILTTEATESNLRILLESDGEWTLAPPTDAQLRQIEGMLLTSGHIGVAASLTRLGPMSLVRLASVGLAQ